MRTPRFGSAPLISSLSVALALLAPGPVASAPEAEDRSSTGIGKWRVGVRVANLPSSGDEGDGLGLIAEGRQALLLLRCAQGEPEVQIVWGRNLGSGPVPVQIGFGDADLNAEHWTLSVGDQGISYPGDGRAFIDRLEAVDRLIVQVTPYTPGGWGRSFDMRYIVGSQAPMVLAPPPSEPLSPLTAVFDVRGLGDIALDLDQGCSLP